MRGSRSFLLGVVAAACLLGSGCTVMRGTPSLTLLSRDLDAGSPSVEVLGPRDSETESWSWFLVFFLTGKAAANHESVVDRFLERHDADLVVDAELTTTTYGIPYVFMQTFTKVEGRPARFVDGGGR